MWGRIATLLLVLAVVVACGGDTADETDTGTDAVVTTQAASDDTVGGTEETEATEAPADEEEPPADEGGGGGIQPGGMVVEPGDASVTADGESLAVTGLLRCIPFSDEDGNLDLQILGDGFQLFVAVNGISQELSMQGRAIGDGESLGVFSNSAISFDGTSYTDDETGEALDAPPFVYSGDRVSGSMVMYDAYGSGDSIEVSFDSPVPADVNDCSL
jgi:hypothetical protein